MSSNAFFDYIQQRMAEMKQPTQSEQVSHTNKLQTQQFMLIDGIKMVYIPAGSFMMGTSNDIYGDLKDNPKRKVTLSGNFWMSEAPITQEQFTRIMGFNPSHFQNMLGIDPIQAMDMPVEGVTWDQAAEFCNALSARVFIESVHEKKNFPNDNTSYGIKPEYKGERFYRAPGIRLPTEAEWEYACTGGDYEVSDDSSVVHLSQVAWYEENSNKHPKPVKGRYPNRFGLHDMLGNVWEWVQDAYQEFDLEDQIDPFNDVGTSRVLRGGAWDSSLKEVNPYFRQIYLMQHSRNNVGFRVVLAA